MPVSAGLDPRFAQFRATGDREIRNALVEDHRWLTTHCVRRFVRKGEPTEDLLQVGHIGLVKAVDRFDPDRGWTFATYAVPTITGELRRHFRDRTWAVRVGRRVKENYLEVKNAADELHQVLGRSPTIPELAQRAGLSDEDTLEALDAGNGYRGVPLDLGDQGDGDEWGDDERRLGLEDPGYAASEARVMLPNLLAVLPRRERHIIKLRFVDEMSQSQIADELGLSQVHVSRLLHASLTTMRRELQSA
jgi:RNA polymerase sigma-B factor